MECEQINNLETARRFSSPSDTSLRGHSDPMDVDAVNSLSRLAKEKGHRVRVMGVLSAVEHIFNETAMHARAQASNRMVKANRASYGPRLSPDSQAKGKGKENKGKSKGKSIRNLKSAKSRCQRLTHGQNTQKAGLSGLVPPDNSETSFRKWQESAQTCTIGHDGLRIVKNETMAGVLMNGMMTGVLLDGTKVGNKRMTLPRAHFSLGCQCHQ